MDQHGSVLIRTDLCGSARTSLLRHNQGATDVATFLSDNSLHKVHHTCLTLSVLLVVTAHEYLSLTVAMATVPPAVPEDRPHDASQPVSSDDPVNSGVQIISENVLTVPPSSSPGPTSPKSFDQHNVSNYLVNNEDVGGATLLEMQKSQPEVADGGARLGSKRHTTYFACLLAYSRALYQSVTTLLQRRQRLLKVWTQALYRFFVAHRSLL